MMEFYLDSSKLYDNISSSFSFWMKLINDFEVNENIKRAFYGKMRGN